MLKKEIKKPSDFTFEADGKVYAFNYPSVMVQNAKGIFEKVSAEQALQREDVLSDLVLSNSQAITLIEDAEEEKPISKLNKTELVEKLTELEVEFDEKATVADLKELLAENLKSEDDAE